MRLKISKRDIILSVLAFCLVIYAEWIYPSQAFNQCVWPLGDNAKHIAIIADPQIVDENTYPGRNSILLWLTELITDRFLARNFRLLHSKMKPDAVIFVGDLFDGGREWENSIWDEEFKRYRRIFPRSLRTAHIDNLPGNHDVGSADDMIPGAYDRFQKHFGKANQIFNVAGHSLVTLDTNALMNEIRPDLFKPARSLLEELKSKQTKYGPVILFTHVPFYRPDGGYCGFEREGKPFSWVKGKQYITELNPPLTNEILQGVKPVYIFSGDDHDACKYTHRWGTDGVSEEHTVKSFSMAMGISRPGFQILSLDGKDHKTDTCLTAKPFIPFIVQGVGFSLLLVSVVISGTVLKRNDDKPSILPLPASSDDKTHKRSKQHHDYISANQTLRGAVTLGVSWICAQLIIHLWSYKQSI